MSQPKKPLLGFLLAVLASATWGTLPLAAQQVMTVVDAVTLVWIRFVVAASVVFLLLWRRKRLPQIHRLGRHGWGWVVLGFVGLSLNFTFFAESLNYIAATTTQVLWQLAPFGMIVAGVLLFGEKIGRFQKIGSLLLAMGLVAFFNDHFSELFHAGRYVVGIAFGAGAALIWVLYGVSQKVLLRTFTSPQILMLIYFGCSLFLSPLASPRSLTQLHGALWGFFAYCCANTLIGYGAFGEALNQWEASKVSVITTLLPVFTMVFAHLAHFTRPDMFAAVDMNAVSYIGAALVVSGAVLAVAGDQLFGRH